MSPKDSHPHLVQMLRIIVFSAPWGFLATIRNRKMGEGIFGSWFRRRAGMGRGGVGRSWKGLYSAHLYQGLVLW